MYNLKLKIIMKNATKLLALTLFTTFIFSCSVEDINEDDTTNTTETIFATGGDESAEADNDRGGD